jgi:alkane 1-monooxygenase
MDQRVVDHYKGDITKANIDPERREEFLAKYAKPTLTVEPSSNVVQLVEDKIAV